MGASSVVFRGADRRADRGSDDCGPGSARTVVLTVCGLLAIAGLPAVSALFPAEIPTAGWPIAAFAAVAGVASTAAWLASWALSGRTWPAYVGLSVVPAWAMAQLAATPAAQATTHPALALAGCVPAAAAATVLALSRRAPQVDSGLRPLRALLFMLSLVAVVVGVGLFAVRPAAILDPSDPAMLAVGGFTTATWLAAAVCCLSRHDICDVERLGLATSLSALALGAADRAIGALDASAGVFGSWATVSGRMVAMVGWALLLVLAVRSLGRSRGVARRRQATLRRARDEIARGLVEEQRRIEERRHDLRSLIAGIQSATTTLTRYRTFLDPGEQELLESALLAEISRLQRSIGGVTTLRKFSLLAAIEPVLVSERAQGATIQTDLPDVDVLGDGDATAALVQNLLTNARRHAPGALVSVSGDVTSAGLVLAVADDGPGLPARARNRVNALFGGRSCSDVEALLADEPPLPGESLLAGESLLSGESKIPAARKSGDAPADGGPGERHGLGLAICARLAAEQGARLRLADTPIGTRIELTLALARVREPAVVG